MSQLAGSANGTSNGIFWTVTSNASDGNARLSIKPGTLRALNPITLTEYWNSSTSGTDTLGNLAKFIAPLPVAGKVLVATQSSKLQIYGLSPSVGIRGKVNIRKGSIR